MRALALCSALALTGLAAGCGTPATGTNQPHFTVAGPTGSTGSQGHAAPTLPPVLATAVAAPTDRTVALAPRTYSDPSSPCYGETHTATPPKALPDCGDAWLGLAPQEIPGNDIMAASPIPHRARVAAGVDVATATALATAFYEQAMLRQFAEAQNNTTLLTALDRPTYANYDHVLGYLKTKGQRATAVPNCMLPTAIRVVAVPASVQQFLAGEGWPAPSQTAVVVDYTACPGITFTAQNGATQTAFGQPTPAAEMFTGHLENVAPFGNIFVVDGSAVCGVAQAKPVCGV